MERGCAHVLLKGGMAAGEDVINRWYGQLFRSEFAEDAIESARWRWTRLPDEFHGSGCTLAAALSAGLARGLSMRAAIDRPSNTPSMPCPRPTPSPPGSVSPIAFPR
jgi:hydroxymethylpyrimidine/phosphomethylpyrimidine kinase